MALSFWTQELAMDLGTANTIIFQNDQIVLDEPSIVAIDNNSGKCIAIGQKAKLMHERSNPGISSCAICAAFGGGGHELAAGCNIACPPEKAAELLMEVVNELLP